MRIDELLLMLCLLYRCDGGGLKCCGVPALSTSMLHTSLGEENKKVTRYTLFTLAREEAKALGGVMMLVLILTRTPYCENVM